MTDFGKRTGEGDMLKSDYDVDDDDVVDSVPGHHASHESAGSDEIDCTGLTGVPVAPLLVDGTEGRTLRASYISILDGTNASTLKCQLVSRFNGNVVAQTDNIAKDATTGSFSLNATGTNLTILNALISGSSLLAIGVLFHNTTTTDIRIAVSKQDDGIRLVCSNPTTGAGIDLTSLVDTGDIYVDILYLTDA